MTAATRSTYRALVADPRSLVEHYTRDGLLEELLGAFRRTQKAPEALTDADLAGVDEFHLGGHRATALIIEALPTPAESVLDVGCGIGGPARAIARATRAQVVGVDPFPELIRTAKALSQFTGWSERTRFEVGSAGALPFEAGTFDAATMIHVGMNIPRKVEAFTDLARVLRAPSKLIVYDIMRLSDAPLSYPLPWAPSKSESFVERPEVYRAAIEGAGFLVEHTRDRTELAREVAAAARRSPAPVNLTHLMGPRFGEMFSNLLRELERGTLAPMEIVARRG